MFSQTQASATAAKVSRLMEKPRQHTHLHWRTLLVFSLRVAFVCCPGPLQFSLSKNKNERANTNVAARLKRAVATSKAELAELRQVWLRHSGPGHKLTLLWLSPSDKPFAINSQLDGIRRRHSPYGGTAHCARYTHTHKNNFVVNSFFGAVCC